MAKHDHSKETLTQIRSELQTIYDIAPVMMGVVDRNRQILYANRAFAAFAAVSEKEVTGGYACGVFGCINSFTDSLGCGYGKNCENCGLKSAIEDTFETGIAHLNVEFNSTLVRNGIMEEIFLLCSTSLIRPGDHSQLLLCISDITDRKKAEAAIRESENNLRSILDSSPFQIWAFDGDVYNFVNKAYIDFTGLETGLPLTADIWTNYVHPDDLEPAGKIWMKAWVEKREHDNYFRLRNKDGNYRDFWCHAVPIFNDSGNFLHFQGFNIDITERKQAEFFLRSSSLAAESSMSAIFIADIRGIITYANNSAAKMWGYNSAAEMTGTSAIDYWTEKSRGKAFFMIEQIIAHGFIKTTGELIGKRLDGSEFIVESNSVVIKNENGEPTGLIGSFNDITERQKSEDAMREGEKRAVRQREALALLAVDTSLLKTDLTEGYRKITELIAATVEVAQAGIWFFSENNENLECITSYDSTTRKHTSGALIPTASIPNYLSALYKEYRIYAMDAQNDPRTLDMKDNYLIPESITSMLDAGIVIKGKLAGIVCLEHKGEKREWQADEEAFASTVATIISQAILNSERMKTKGLLRESEQKFREVYDSVNEAIFIEDTFNGKIIDCNRRTVEMYGYENKEQILRCNIGDLSINVAPYDENGAQQLIRKTVEEGPQIIDWLAKKKNGDVFWIEISLKKTEIGGENRMLVVVRDITERKRAETALRDSEKTMSNILEKLKESQAATKIGSLDWDLISNKVWWSDELYRIFEVDPEVYIPSLESNAKFVHPDDTDEFHDAAARAIETGEPLEREIRIITPNGKIKNCRFSANIEFDDHHNATRMSGTFSDITQQVETFNELRQAKERAEESDRLKSAFLANMSHEIRTPMNGILGFAELLKEPGLTGDEHHKYLGIIEKSGLRMLNIINDIVDISKIEAGQMEVLCSETNVNEQLAFVYSFFKPEAEKKGIKFGCKNGLPDKEAILTTDREKIYAILTNLVKNALKFTNKGSIEFGYDLVETQNNASLQFFVSDTGIGIPANRQQAVFDRFVQADLEDKNAFQGAGLGLSITKAYVEMLGGKIWLVSEEGKGTTFYFSIPYNSFAQENQITDIDTPAPENEPGVKKLKILIVEDDETSDLFLTMMLEKQGHTLMHCTNGTRAIEICRINPDINLVLMDIKLPGMDGYETTRQIRQFNNNLVIIAQTAYALAGDREKAIEAGCNEYLPKPVNKEDLNTLISRYF